uniref:Uncharacterized protein n=1 Tax=Arundo donax TaxID=35708 RepID=A0A0A9CMC6_ARUDO
MQHRSSSAAIASSELHAACRALPHPQLLNPVMPLLPLAPGPPSMPPPLPRPSSSTSGLLLIPGPRMRLPPG